MAVKDRLHALVDQLPETRLDRAQQLLEALLADDPVGISLALAPIDDEPETEEERALVEEARAELARGEYLTTDELRRSLGL
jgi:hypothetical protein